MIWLGIGLCIIGLALLIISVIAIKPLKRLSDVLGSLKQTTDELPKTVNEVTSQTTAAMETGVDVLHDVKGKLNDLQPVFQMVGKFGQTANSITNTVSQKLEAVARTDTFQKTVKNQKSLLGVIVLIALLLKRKNK